MQREVKMGCSLTALADQIRGRLTELSQVELADASSLPTFLSGLTLPSAKLGDGGGGAAGG